MHIIILLYWFQDFINSKQRSNFSTKTIFLRRKWEESQTEWRKIIQVIMLHQQPLCQIYGSIIWIIYGWNYIFNAYFLSIEQIHSQFISSHMHAHTTDMKKRISKFCCLFVLKTHKKLRLLLIYLQQEIKDMRCASSMFT